MILDLPRYDLLPHLAGFMNEIEAVVSPVVLQGKKLSGRELVDVNSLVSGVELKLRNLNLLNSLQSVELRHQIASIQWALGLYQKSQKEEVGSFADLGAEYERSMHEADLGLISNSAYREARRRVA